MISKLNISGRHQEGCCNRAFSVLVRTVWVVSDGNTPQPGLRKEDQEYIGLDSKRAGWLAVSCRARVIRTGSALAEPAPFSGWHSADQQPGL